jgi:hypothetical protein
MSTRYSVVTTSTASAQQRRALKQQAHHRMLQQQAQGQVPEHHDFSQAGQVLPLGLILCATVLVAWVLSINLGRLVHSKASLLRATDAAVYSAAVAQARALNLHAYLNRAQLAQQIAMAHLITMASAQRYRANMAQRAMRLNPPVVLIGILFGPSYAAAYLAAKVGGLGDQVALAQISDAFSDHDEVIHRVIDQVRGEQIKRLSHARQHIVNQVLVNNVGASGSTMLGATMAELGLVTTFTVDELPGFVSRFSSADARWQALLKRVSKQYGFLSDRHHTKRNFWAINIRCPLKRHELRRKGFTRLGANGTWTVQDTQSFHALRYNRIIGCYHREYPMGWALVSSTARVKSSQQLQSGVEAEPQNFSKKSFWRWVGDQGDAGWNIFSGGDNRLAGRWAATSEIRWNTQGVPSYTALTPKRKEALRLAIAVQQQSALIHTGTALEDKRFGGRLTLSQDDRIQRLHAEAAAQTYFAPPEASRGPAAAPNLFQPFWRARLIDVAEAKKQSATP